MSARLQYAILWRAVSSQVQTDADKVSMEYQDELNRRWCADNGYIVAASLVVPGFSRRESRVDKALGEFRRQGVTAYDELEWYWDNGGADVLVCYDESRLGRSAALLAHVMENTILAGMRIWRHEGGWVDRSGLRVQTALSIITATAPIDHLVDKRKVAMRKRAAAGIPYTSTPPLTHEVVRDSRGKAVAFALSELILRIRDDLADVLCGTTEHEPTAWGKVETVLAERYGHVNPRTGRPFKRTTFYTLMHRPPFWGSTYQGFHYRGRIEDAYTGWAYDPTVEPPEGVTVYRDTIPAVYEGAQAARVLAEMHRREHLRGTARPGNSKTFSGLLICGTCAYIMGYQLNHAAWSALYTCHSRFVRRVRNPERCTASPYSIRETDVQRWIDARLGDWLQASYWQQLNAGGADLEARRAGLQAQLVEVESEAAALIDRLARVPLAMLDAHQRKMEQVAARQTALQQQLDAVERELARCQSADNERARAALAAPDFWQQEPRVINQWLHALLGDWRIVILDGQPVGLAPKPRRYKSR